MAYFAIYTSLSNCFSLLASIMVEATSDVTLLTVENIPTMLSMGRKIATAAVGIPTVSNTVHRAIIPLPGQPAIVTDIRNADTVSVTSTFRFNSNPSERAIRTASIVI